MKPRILIFVVFALLAVSCNKVEIDPSEPEEQTGLVDVSYQIGFSSQTASLLDKISYSVWKVGDKVAVYDPIEDVTREFVVDKVAGNVAQISGKISAGEFPFLALYPSSALIAWETMDNCSFNFPSDQTLSKGFSVDPDALVFYSYIEDPAKDKLLFDNAVSLVEFCVDKPDVESIHFDFKSLSGDATSYSIVCEDSCFEIGTNYYLSVCPVNFKGGYEIECDTEFGYSYSAGSDYALNALKNSFVALGNVSQGTPSLDYLVTKTVSYSNLDRMIDASGLLAGLTPELRALVPTLEKAFFPLYEQPVTSYVYEHRSIGPDLNTVTLSAIVYVPQSALDGSYSLKGIVIANHGSICSDKERPTYNASAESVIAWMGYAVVLSDYCGFGADAQHPQAYLNADITARGSIDALLAAKQMLSELGVKSANRIYNIGYSQGGFNGLANLKFVSEHPEYELSFYKTFVGGGPFDIQTTWEEYLSDKFPLANSFAPITLASFNECDNLGIPYSSLFKEPLLSNYQDWILSKKYNRGKIDDLLGTTSINDLLTDELCNSSSSVHKTLMEVCQKHSLDRGWVPADKSNIYIYHSKQDDIVPYENFVSIKNYLDGVAGSCNITYTDGNDGGHMQAVSKWATSVIRNW